ncbi:MAG: hypothetical protein RLN88_13190 [Ekhidna sp.]|uniref:hypothetical protein n=1 Tax=Ekhidna sp. TaxID=2608089 RepID=UPI0032ECF66A
MVTWLPHKDQGKQFEAGYKRHLTWHSENGDTWEWYGWYVVSGERLGTFIDASFDHSWEEYDSPPVDLAGDAADNNINVYPHADLKNIQRLIYLKELSRSESLKLDSKFIRLITINASDVSKAEEQFRVFKKANSKYEYRLFRIVDGGDGAQFLMFIKADSFKDYAKSESVVNELSSSNFRSVTIETLYLSKDLSLLK